jgi:chemotaxis-related protein WspD
VNSPLPPPHTGVPAAQAVRPEGSSAEVSPCWNRVGVQGDGTCPELPQFVHCRNCPVYSSAGVALLNRPLPEQYRRAWTEQFAQHKKLQSPGNSSALLFRIRAEWFALPTYVFQEVAERRRIHSLPHRRQGLVLGLVNIRGELLVCVSLGHLLGVEQLPTREELRAAHDRLLVTNWEGSRLVFPADEVQGTHRFCLQELKAPPATLAHSGSSFTQGILPWRERLVCYLNPELLFSTLNRSLA